MRETTIVWDMTGEALPIAALGLIGCPTCLPVEAGEHDAQRYYTFKSLIFLLTVLPFWFGMSTLT
jgi:hypothetical protein